MQADSITGAVRQLLSIQGTSQLAALTGQLLVEGTRIPAQVQSYDPASGQALLRAPGGSISAQSQLPLSAGQNLLLLVESAGTPIVLRVLDSAQAQAVPAGDPAVAAQAAQRIQAALQLLLANPARILIQAPDAASAETRLPPDLLRYALPLLEENLSPPELRQLLRRFNQPAEALLRRMLQGSAPTAAEAPADPAALLRAYLAEQLPGPRPAVPQALIDAIVQLLQSKPDLLALQSALERLPRQPLSPAGPPFLIDARVLEDALPQLLRLAQTAGDYSRAGLTRHVEELLNELAAQSAAARSGSPPARATGAKQLLALLLERAPAQMLLSLRDAPPPVRELLQLPRLALQALQAAPGESLQPALRGLLAALQSAAAGKSAVPPDAQLTQRIFETLQLLDRPGLSFNARTPTVLPALAELIPQALLRLAPAGALAPHAAERRLLQNLDQLRLALAAAGDGATGGDPLLQRLQFAQGRLLGNLQGSSSALTLFQTLETTLQLLQQLQADLRQLDPTVELLAAGLRNWLRRFPPDIIRSVPANLHQAPPLVRDALSELQAWTTLFGATLAGAELLGGQPRLQYQALRSVDALLTQLFGLRSMAQAPARQPVAPPPSAAARQQLDELHARLNQLLRENAGGPALRSAQHGAARTLLQDLALLLAARGAGGAQGALEPQAALRELLNGLDAFRLQNAQALDQGRPLHLLLPVLGPGLLALAQIKVLRGAKEQEQGGAGGGFNLLIALELAHAGPLKFEIHVRRKKLAIMLTTAKLTLKKLAERELETFRRALRECGFELGAFNCVFDPDLNLNSAQSEQRITYRQVRRQA